MKKIGAFLCLMVMLLFAGMVCQGSEAKAASTYKIKVNKQCCTVTVYKYNETKQKYKAIKAFICSPGYATPTGTFNLGEKIRWHTLDGPTYGQYCSRITGSILFHSVWYYEPKKNTQSYVQYNKLGTLASHGCVRLTCGDSKWIYDNIPSGTPVTIYQSAKPGPLGKPAAIKVKGYQGWDPTDPDPENPYAKKNPKIKGVKSQEIKYGSAFDIKKGITATNTTGFDVTGRVKATIYYRASKAVPYVEVKTLDTKKAGTYRVVYSVVDEIGHEKKKAALYTIKPSKMIKKITLNKTEKTLYVGGKAELKEFVLQAKAIKPADASIQDLEFTTGGKTIATVDADGTVHAKKAGEVYITVTALDGSGVSARCHIIVEQLVKTVTLTAPSGQLNIGETMQLTTTVGPENAKNQEVKYSSSDKTIATVDQTGLVTAIAPGTVTIKVKAKDKGKKNATITLLVIDPNAPAPVSDGAVSVAGLSF